jgi:hypothetical protein
MPFFSVVCSSGFFLVFCSLDEQFFFRVRGKNSIVPFVPLQRGRIHHTERRRQRRQRRIEEEES